MKLLEDIMDEGRILIFMDTKKGCDQITRQLRMDGWPALSIHGDKSQAERDWVLSEFKSGKSPIMTATDVAARGLGICESSFLHGDSWFRIRFILLFYIGPLELCPLHFQLSSGEMVGVGSHIDAGHVDKLLSLI